MRWLSFLIVLILAFGVFISPALADTPTPTPTSPALPTPTATAPVTPTATPIATGDFYTWDVGITPFSWDQYHELDHTFFNDDIAWTLPDGLADIYGDALGYEVTVNVSGPYEGCFLNFYDDNSDPWPNSILYPFWGTSPRGYEGTNKWVHLFSTNDPSFQLAYGGTRADLYREYAFGDRNYNWDQGDGYLEPGYFATDNWDINDRSDRFYAGATHAMHFSSSNQCGTITVEKVELVYVDSDYSAPPATEHNGYPDDVLCNFPGSTPTTKGYCGFFWDASSYAALKCDGAYCQTVEPYLIGLVVHTNPSGGMVPNRLDSEENADMPGGYPVADPFQFVSQSIYSNMYGGDRYVCYAFNGSIGGQSFDSSTVCPLAYDDFGVGAFNISKSVYTAPLVDSAATFSYQPTSDLYNMDVFGYSWIMYYPDVVAPTPTPTPTATPDFTSTPTAYPTATPYPTATEYPTITPTVPATYTPNPTLTPAPSPTDYAGPVPTNTLIAQFPTLTTPTPQGGTPYPTFTPGVTSTPGGPAPIIGGTSYYDGTCLVFDYDGFDLSQIDLFGVLTVIDIQLPQMGVVPGVWDICIDRYELPLSYGGMDFSAEITYLLSLLALFAVFAIRNR